MENITETNEVASSSNTFMSKITKCLRETKNKLGTVAEVVAGISELVNPISANKNADEIAKNKTKANLMNSSLG